MPLPFIRNMSDKKRWQQAIQLTKKRKALRNKDDPNYDPKLAPISNVFAYANFLFHNVLNEEEFDTTKEGEIEGIIMSEEDNNIYNKILENVFNSDNYKNLEETKKFEIIENTFIKYKENTSQKLEELLNYNSGSNLGNNNIAGLYGMGGYRSEPPVGPIVYGTNQLGLTNKTDDSDAAVVVIPDKKNNYNPLDYTMDQNGNVTSDVIASQNKIDDEDQYEKSMDIFTSLENLGYTQEDLEDMSDEELKNISYKALKQKMNESVEMSYEVLDESGTLEARELLARKMKIKKAIAKKGNKYLLNQDDISKLIRSYGFTYDKKLKKWRKKVSPTFLGRKILHSKFLDKDVLLKKDNQFIIHQDEVLKRLRHHNMKWDKKLKTWVKKVITSKYNVVQPKISKNKPKKPNNYSIYYKKPETDEDNDETKIIKKDNIDKKDDIKKENPPKLLTFDEVLSHNKNYVFSTRFILAVELKDKKYVNYSFDENLNKYIPEIDNLTVVESVEKNNFHRNDNEIIIKDENNKIPNKLIEIGENEQTILARAILCNDNDISFIKLNDDYTPEINKDDIITKIKENKYVWIPEHNNWMLQVSLHESIIINEKLNQPKKGYSTVDIQEAQSKILLRAIQFGVFNRSVQKNGLNQSQSKILWDTKFADGGNSDPFNMNDAQIEKILNNLNYNFSDDDVYPMWTYKNKYPQILNSLGISEKEFIARGILGSKKPEYLKIRSNFGNNPEMNISSDKTMRRLKDSGYSWNDEYGFIKQADDSTIPSKSEYREQQWLESMKNIPFTSMKKDDQIKYKEITGRQITGIDFNTWQKMTPKDKNKAIKKAQEHSQFDNKTKTWKDREKPVKNSLLKRIFTLVGSSLGKGVSSVSKTISNEFQNIGKYN